MPEQEEDYKNQNCVENQLSFMYGGGMARKIEKIDMIAVSELQPYQRNSRKHSEQQIKQIESSIKEFGFTNPVLIDGNNGIIAGHGRVEAAKNIGMAEVPCIRLEHLTKSQKKAYVIADNKLALNASWDFDILAVEIDELNDNGFNLDLLGFTQEELNELIGTPNEAPMPGSSTKEIDPDDYEMGCTCPKCGFQFNDK